MTLVKRIKEIGKSGICTDEDIHLFLPNFPTLSGSEFIFTIGWGNAHRYIDDEVEHFIKGLHLIEMKYRAASHHDFGFGSPSPTYNVIEKLKPKNPILAENLNGMGFGKRWQLLYKYKKKKS